MESCAIGDHRWIALDGPWELHEEGRPHAVIDLKLDDASVAIHDDSAA